MHEYFLYSQVPASRHNQVVNILAGVTASQPVNISEQIVVYTQLKPVDLTGSKKGQTNKGPQPQRPSIYKLVRDLNIADGPGSWRLRVEEVPEPAVKLAISRNVSERDTTAADLERFRTDSGWHKLMDQFDFTTSGVRFVHNNVIIRVTRLYYTPSSTVLSESLESPPPLLENMELFDSSGTYLAEAIVRTEDNSGSTIREKAMKELSEFVETVKGAIDFRVPDRLALDPRVKGV